MAKADKFLVDTLKALGVCDWQTHEELSRDAIEKKIKLSDSTQIRDSVKLAVGRQMQKDHQGEDIQSQELAYAFNAAKMLLRDNKIFDGVQIKTQKGKVLTNEELCDKVLNKLCVDFDNATDTLLAGVIAGIPERKGIKESQGEQLTAVLSDVVLDGYQAFLKEHPELNAETFSPADYKEVKNQLKIAQILVELLGDEQKAMQLLNQPVTADSPAWHNAALSDSYKAASAARQARGEAGALAGVSNDGQVRVLDLLMSMSKTVTKAQVTAFCEQRATEQNQVNGQRMSVDDPARLVNVLGHEGRKAVEQTIDGHISNKLIPATKTPRGTPLPDHAWRGYTKMAALIKETVKHMYGAVQTGEFVERMLAKKNAPISHDHGRPQWEIEKYATMPETYRDAQTGKLNAAGELFERVQARLMSDKVKITEYQVKVQAKPKDQTAIAQLQYYQYRVMVANDTLAQMADDTAADPDLLQDQNYTQYLDNQILLLANRNYDPKKTQALNALLDVDVVSAIVEQDEKRTSEAYWVDALQTFKSHNDQAVDTAANDASYRMLAELFGLSDRYGKDITKADLANLLQNVPNGPFNPKKVDQFIKGLTAKPNAKDALTAAECRQGLHDAATKFLEKVKYQDAYANYQLSATANDQLSHMKNM